MKAGGRGGADPFAEGAAVRQSTVKVLEAGIVGSLEYKIVRAEKSDDLYQ